METEPLPIDIDADLLNPDADGKPATGAQELGLIKTPLNQISKSEARKAARALGLSKMAVDNIDAQSVLGRYIEQSGAIRITTGEFMVSNSVRDELIQLCRNELKNSPSLKKIMQVGGFLNKLLESKDNALKIINQAQNTGMLKPVQDPPNNQLPPRGAQISPVQINNSQVTFTPNKD